jgi:flagellar biosynthesis/type III secretory pathway protein FliH
MTMSKTKQNRPAVPKEPAGGSTTWEQADELWQGLALADRTISREQADELAEAFQAGKRAGRADGFKRGFAAALASANVASNGETSTPGTEGRR